MHQRVRHTWTSLTRVLFVKSRRLTRESPFPHIINDHNGTTFLISAHYSTTSSLLTLNRRVEVTICGNAIIEMTILDFDIQLYPSHLNSNIYLKILWNFTSLMTHLNHEFSIRLHFSVQSTLYVTNHLTKHHVDIEFFQWRIYCITEHDFNSTPSTINNTSDHTKTKQLLGIVSSLICVIFKSKNFISIIILYPVTSK